MFQTAKATHTARGSWRDCPVRASPRGGFGYASCQRRHAVLAVVESRRTHTPIPSTGHADAPAQPQQRASPIVQAIIHAPSRRLLLTGALLSCAAGWVEAAAAAAAAPPQKTPGTQQLDGYLDDMMEDIRAQVPEQVAELDAIMKLEDDAVDLKALDAIRLKNGFKRSKDGRVFVRNPKGKWFTVKADMYMAGYLLLQDAGGLTWYLAPAEAGELQQVDLSDDLVVAMLFSSGAWVPALRPLEVEGDKGKAEQLKLTEEQFRELLSVMNQEQ